MKVYSFKLIVDQEHLKHKYASRVEIDVLYAAGLVRPDFIDVFDIKISPLVAASIKNWITFNSHVQEAAANNFKSVIADAKEKKEDAHA